MPHDGNDVSLAWTSARRVAIVVLVNKVRIFIQEIAAPTSFIRYRVVPEPSYMLQAPTNGHRLLSYLFCLVAGRSLGDFPGKKQLVQNTVHLRYRTAALVCRLPFHHSQRRDPARVSPSGIAVIPEVQLD